MRNKETVDLDGRRSGEDLGGTGGEETILRMYCMKKVKFQ